MTKDRFRAWDKSFQKYCENVIVSTINGEITVYGRLANGNTALIPPTHVVLEQCTGLKDEAGKLIYEGDFLINHDGNIGFIEFKNACFMLTAINEDNIMSTQDWTTCKVIGNIHENPELLEANNGN